MSRATTLAALVVVLSLQGTAWAWDPQEPPAEELCPGNGVPQGDPLGTIVIKNVALELNDDFEVDFPFFDDHADVYGKLEVDVGDGLPESFDIPLIPDDDSPQWQFVYLTKPAKPGVPVHVVFWFYESDGVSGDERIYVSPASHPQFDFWFDTCALAIRGDYRQDASVPIVVPAGNASDHGRLRFDIGMRDHRALSPDGIQDVVLEAFDLIQVVPDQTRLVTGKPVVAMLTAYNNTTKDLEDIFGRVEISENGVLVYDRLKRFGRMKAGEVRTIYIGEEKDGDEVIIPAGNDSCRPSELEARGSIVLLGDALGVEIDDDPKLCWVANNDAQGRAWNVVRTDPPHLEWLRIGSTSTPSQADVETLRTQSMAFIRGAYPVASIWDSVSGVPYTPTAGGIADALLQVLLPYLGIPAIENAWPYLIILQLQAQAVVANLDVVYMGAVPDGWFSDLAYYWDGWEEVEGVSAGEIAPRAVLFEPQGEATINDVEYSGYGYVTPAHELGHTFGLSLDPTIKDGPCTYSWLPDIFWIAACGASHGFDEYSSSAHPLGVATSGYWYAQDPAVPFGGVGVEGPICDAGCMMGESLPNSFEPAMWSAHKSWVDQRDYVELMDSMAVCEKPKSTAPRLFVSGMINAKNDAALAWTHVNRQHTGRADFVDDKSVEAITPYAIVMLDAYGQTLSVANVPVDWRHPDVKSELGKLPVTMFAGWADFPAKTAAFELRNRVDGKVLLTREVRTKPPTAGKLDLRVTTGKEGDRVLLGSWTVSGDKNALQHFVYLSADGKTWWPLTGGLDAPWFEAKLGDLKSGAYIVRAVTSDGFNVVATTASLKL